MSAILGILQKDGRLVDTTMGLAMEKKMAHYAVNGKNTFSENSILLGHLLFDVNRQHDSAPLPLQSGDFVITSSARIDNRAQLTKILGISPNKQHITDSWLIIEAYKKWGDSCPIYLEGEFAFVIWNKTEKRLFGATDHLGRRTFYYYDGPGMFVFASEIKAVLAAMPLPHEFNHEPIIGSITKDYRSDTFVKGVFALQSGHTITAGVDSPARTTRYWSASVPGKYSFSSNSEWGECLRELTKTSIRNGIDTNYPVGIFLSGGLDSSLVALLAGEILREQNKPLFAFSGALPVDYKGFEKDERYYQNLVRGCIPNLDHTSVYPDPGLGPFSNIELVINQSDDIPNAYHYLDTGLCEAAAKKGVRSLLNGFMGDYFISRHGYDSLYQLLKKGEIKKSWHLGKLMRENYGTSMFDQLKAEVLRHTQLWKALGKARNSFRKDNFSSGFSPQLEAIMVQRRLDSPFAYEDSKRKKFMTMNNGIFGRINHVYHYRDIHYGFQKVTPFMDKQLFDFYCDVPDEVFISKGFRRGLIREAMQGIAPPELQWRKDKNAYTPDFIRRMAGQKDKVEEILAFSGASQIVDPKVLRNELNIKSLQVTHKKMVGAVGSTMALLSAAFVKYVGEKYKM